MPENAPDGLETPSQTGGKSDEQEVETRVWVTGSRGNCGRTHTDEDCQFLRRAKSVTETTLAEAWKTMCRRCAGTGERIEDQDHSLHQKLKDPDYSGEDLLTDGGRSTPVANDCVYTRDDGRFDKPKARNTHLPEVRRFEAERAGDGTLSTVEVRVHIPSGNDVGWDRWVATYRLDGETATPHRVGRPNDKTTAPCVPTYFDVLTAANEGVLRLDDVTTVKSPTDYLNEIAERTPAEGWEVRR